MFEEIVKSTQSHVNERLSSPLMGSFAFAWCLWNYKFLVVLVSAASVSQTFNLIDGLVFPDRWTMFFRGFLYPLISASAYIFLYPYPARIVYRFSRNRQRDINNIRRQIENETPLTLEESRNIRSEVFRSKNEHVQELDQKNREIELLNRQLVTLKASSSDKLPEPKNKVSADLLEPSQISMLGLVDKNNGAVNENFLLKQSSVKKVQAEYDLGELVNLKLLTREYDPEQEWNVVSFTHEGRRALLASQVNISESSA